MVDTLLSPQHHDRLDNGDDHGASRVRRLSLAPLNPLTAQEQPLGLVKTLGSPLWIRGTFGPRGLDGTQPQDTLRGAGQEGTRSSN
jgi:hypothetical protein